MAQTIFNEDGNGNGMPWQVKAVGLIGVPSVIAIYLVWALVADVRINQQSSKENLALHAIQTNSVSEQNKELLQVLKRLQTSVDRLCANTAKNYNERNECFR